MNGEDATSDGVAVMLKRVSKRFGSNEVLSGIDLQMQGGEVVALVGPNGGGKSTLLMLIAGLLRPSSGDVRVYGVEASQVARSRSGEVGLVTARPGLYPLLTGWENLEHFGGLFGLGSEQVRSRAAMLVSQFRLTEAMTRPVSGWSSGMQQKLSLVRALFLSPRVLLFDEPTANLDPLAAELLYAEMRQRADEGMVCVLVTHDLAAAETIADRAVLLDEVIHREMA
ncbi:MAG: ABC transporter ATP-binding protein, partial [Myxococcota bacterium]